jgi:N4-gp56 family major capsid protein
MDTTIHPMDMSAEQQVRFAQFLMSKNYRPLAGGALDNFIPQMWSARILEALRKALVFSQPLVVNHDYEGDIQAAGDTVKINSIGDPTIFDYTKNTDMPSPETLDDSQKTLLIDAAKAFNFQVDDVDKAQQQPKVMDYALGRAGYRMADTTDQYVAGKMVQANQNVLYSVATPLLPVPQAGATGVYEMLVDLSVLLDEANVPTDGRWAIIPPWIHGMLVKDQRFVSYAAVDVLYNRQVGEAAGFSILTSNNVPQIAAPGGATDPANRYGIITGHQMAFSFANQINSVEAYRPQNRFGDAVKGLHLFGGGVIRPEALATAYVVPS